MRAPTKRLFLSALAVLIFFAVIEKSAHDIWAATVVYVILLFLVDGVILAKGGEYGLRLPLLLFSGVLAAAFFASFYFSVNPSESALALLDWISFIAIFFCASNLIETEQDLNYVLAFLAPVFLWEFSVMFGEWLWNLYKNRHGLMDYAEPIGTFVNANAAVAFTLLWLPSLAKRARALHARWYWAAATACAILILVLVSSAWSAVCLASAAALLWGPQFRTARRRAYVVAAIVMGVLVLLVLVNKILITFGWGGLSAARIQPTSRIGWWISGVRMWKDHLWLGVGLGNFPSAYLAYKSGASLNTFYAHSFWVEILAETGILGFAAVCLWIVAWIRTSKSALSSQKALGAGIFMFALYMTINVSLEYLSNLLALGLALGTMVGIRNTPPAWHLRSSLRVVLVALSFLLIPPIVSPFLASRLVVDANLDLGEKKTDSAEKKFLSAIETDRRSWEAYRGLALSYAASGQVWKAILAQRSAIDRNSLSGHLWWELGRLLESTGDSAGAILAYQRSVELDRGYRAYESDLIRLGGSPTGGVSGEGGS